jgi:hypothetical protein
MSESENTMPERHSELLERFLTVRTAKRKENLEEDLEIRNSFLKLGETEGQAYLEREAERARNTGAVVEIMTEPARIVLVDDEGRVVDASGNPIDESTHMCSQ